jgi:hypothetical protein
MERVEVDVRPIGTLMGFRVISSALMRRRSSIRFQGASCRSGPRARKVSARRVGLELVRGRVRERQNASFFTVPVLYLILRFRAILGIRAIETWPKVLI